MTKEQYEPVAYGLLLKFAKVYSPSGPPHDHHNQDARDLSAVITHHAKEYDPAWYPPLKR